MQKICGQRIVSKKIKNVLSAELDEKRK